MRTSTCLLALATIAQASRCQPKPPTSSQTSLTSAGYTESAPVSDYPEPTQTASDIVSQSSAEASAEVTSDAGGEATATGSAGTETSAAETSGAETSAAETSGAETSGAETSAAETSAAETTAAAESEATSEATTLSTQVTSEVTSEATSEATTEEPSTTVAEETSATSAEASESSEAAPNNGAITGRIVTDCVGEGVVALTFDDGPYTYTNEILDILEERGAIATFFVNGNNWASLDDPVTAGILQRAYGAGHLIGSHTWSHPNLDELSVSEVNSQLTQLSNKLNELIGRRPAFLRPPYGSCGSACLGEANRLGYTVVNWNIDTLDYANQDDIQVSVDLFNNELPDTATGGHISLAHDVHGNTPSLVAEMLNTITARGFRTVTVGECVGLPESQWYL